MAHVMVSKRRTVFLGVILLVFLALSYFENMVFFEYSGKLFIAPNLSAGVIAVIVVFVHNVLVVSLILLAMTFYVELVFSFFKPRKYEYVVVQHPRLFALIFTCMIIFLSIFRVSMIVFESVLVSGLATIVLLILPNGLIEGYGIYLTIEKTLGRNITMKDLLTIYLLFFIAAVVEVGFIRFLFVKGA